MAKVTFNFYDDDGTRISHQIKEEDIFFVGCQIDRFIDFLRGQGFQDASIFHYLDERVEEYDKMNPGKLDGEFQF